MLNWQLETQCNSIFIFLFKNIYGKLQLYIFVFPRFVALLFSRKDRLEINCEE